MKKRPKQNHYTIGKLYTIPRTIKYGDKGDLIKIINYVKNGQHSYFVVESKINGIYIIPSKYINRRRLLNSFELPIPDTKKPPKPHTTKPTTQKPHIPTSTVKKFKLGE